MIHKQWINQSILPIASKYLLLGKLRSLVPKIVNSNDDGYIEIGLGGPTIGPYTISFYQIRFWFEICFKWKGKVPFFVFLKFSFHTIITNDGKK